MRIIAGKLGGRQFDSPGTSKTHPMSDKMRGALFNILGDISGLTVLDPFAGSGALAFESLSRGAASTLLIEQDRVAQRVIEESIRALRLSRGTKLIRASAGASLQTSEGQRFDLVLCDPPYHDLQLNLLMRLAARAHNGGLVVLSLPAEADDLILLGCKFIERRTYGDGSLAFYRRIE